MKRLMKPKWFERNCQSRSRSCAGILAACALVGVLAGGDATAAHVPNPDIELMETGSLASTEVDYEWAYYRNVGHPCAKNNGASAAGDNLVGTSNAYATFMVLSPIGLAPLSPAPLYVHSHGGLIGAFSDTKVYNGTVNHIYLPGRERGERRLDQETSEDLALIGLTGPVPEDRGNPKLSAGLLNELRLSGNDFRFLFMSMCDHDAYSGEGAFDEVANGYNPYNVDSANNPIERRADGLTTSLEALRFVEQQISVSHLFLGGASAGSIGSLSLGIRLEELGTPATGIIADSHNDSLELEDLTDNRCYAFSTDHLGVIRTKVFGPGLNPPPSGQRISVDGFDELPNTPLLHIWDQNDVGGNICPDPGGPAGSFGDLYLTPLYANDWHHIRLAQAITANKGRGNPAHDASHNVWLCVPDPRESGRPCAEHSPTKYTVGNSVDHKTMINDVYPSYAGLVARDYDIDYVNPIHYPSFGVGDYNKWIMAWIQRRIDGASEPPSVPSAKIPGAAILGLLLLWGGSRWQFAKERQPF